MIERTPKTGQHKASTIVSGAYKLINKHAISILKEPEFVLQQSNLQKKSIQSPKTIRQEKRYLRVNHVNYTPPTNFSKTFIRNAQTQS